MEDIKKKLEELKKEVYYAKHADLSIIDKIDVKVKELDKLIKNHGDLSNVSESDLLKSRREYLLKEVWGCSEEEMSVMELDSLDKKQEIEKDFLNWANSR